MLEIKNLSTYFKGPLDKLLNFISTESQQLFSNRLLEYQVEEYKRNFFSKTILHRAEAKPLNEFYQPLFIEKFDEKVSEKKTHTNSAKKLLKKWSYLTIIGNAGSGKSTIVKYLFTNCFSENYKIPIKIELRYLNDFKGNISDYIYNEIFKFNKLGFSINIIDRLLDNDSFVFFLDGYDEINSNIKSQTTKDIDSFVKRYPNNKYVITSRPYTNIDLLPLFTNFHVCNLEQGEIASFVKKQIPNEEFEMAEKIIKAINESENRNYRAFLSNPLLLSMFILTFQSYSDIPQKRSEFYNQVFDTLFSVHDSMSKLAYVREKLSGLPKDQFEEILRSFSFISFFEEKFIFPSNYLTDKFDFIKNKKKNLAFDNELFINDLQVAIGILNKEGLDYTFPHRSLQEYFAASYIEKLSLENKKALYAKLRKEIEDNYSTLINKDHFFSLLSEIDYNSLSRFLTIPLFESTFLLLAKKETIDDAIGYEFYSRLLLLCVFLLKSGSQHIELHNELIANNITYAYFGTNKSGKFAIPNKKDSFYEHMDFEIMIEKVKYFKECGQKIINHLRCFIDDIDKSDEEIIKLI